jgi:flagella basal body P-ring formation protein FlgA
LKSNRHYFVRLIAIAWLTGVLLLVSVGELWGATPTLVRVAGSSLVDGERLYLGKIAKIEGSDPAIIDKLASLDLGRAPLPGKTREFEENTFMRHLRQNGFDPDELVLEIPSKVIVKRSLIVITQEEIKKLVSDYISENLIRDRHDASIKDIYVAEDLNLPGGRITFTVNPPSSGEIMGKIPFTIDFDVNGEFHKTIRATAEIDVFTDVVVTQKPLGRYQPITEDDIELQRLNLADLPSDVITDPDEVLGKRTRRVIGSKTVLRSNLIELPPLVKRGDVVVIIAETAGFKITALGQVKKKGRLGERIPVTNFDSNKLLYGRVLDANTVKVEF